MRRFLKAIKSMDPGLLKPFEALAAPPTVSKDSSSAPMLILLALPRSGSTFCYQAICHRFDVNYFSNLVYMGAKYPFMSTRVANRFCSNYISDFKSNFGFINGLNGPAEANDIWGDWFDQHLLEASPAPEEKRLARALNYFDWLWASTGKPFMAGWVGHVLYAEQMARLFPNAIFVNLVRGTQDVAVSLIRARRHSDQGIGQWFSTRSRECLGEPSSDPYGDVALQVAALQKKAAAFVSTCADRVFRLDYEDLCKNPEGEMQRLLEFCTGKGFKLVPRTETPEIMAHERKPRMDEDYRRIKEAIANLECERNEG